MTSLQFLQDQGFPTQYVSLLSLLQIVYMTATLPLILLIIFFFRGVHLKGYQEGLALLFIPEVSKSVEGLTLKMSALKLFTMANLRYQLSWKYFTTQPLV